MVYHVHVFVDRPRAHLACINYHNTVALRYAILHQLVVVLIR